MPNKFKLMLASFVMISLTGCGGGGSSDSTEVTQDSEDQISTIIGYVQKGPVIFGSQVWISELNDSLQPTGRTFTAQTNDDLGGFSLTSTLKPDLVEILADGYYMDETTGGLSDGRVSLSAVADLKIDSTPIVNILTTIQTPRLKKIMDSGIAYTDALLQSRNEVLNSFGIDPDHIEELNGLFSMEINGNEDPDAVLLAISSILMEVAKVQAASSSGTKAAALTNFISQLARDIGDDGLVQNTNINSAIRSANQTINLQSIRTNVETYYANKGDQIVAPKFEEWVDVDGTEIVPRRIIPATGLVFNDVSESEAISVITSNTLSLYNLDNGTDYFVASSEIDKILKNGALVPGKYTTVNSRDTLALRNTSGAFGVSKSLSLQIGSTDYSWSLSTKSPTIQYRSVDGNSPYPSLTNTTDPKTFHAFPIQISQNFKIKYLGTSFMAYGNGSVNYPGAIKVALYSDNSGVPGQELIATTNFADYFGAVTLNVHDESTMVISDRYKLFGAYFGTSGLNVMNGQKLWVVFQFPSASDPGSYGNSNVDYSERKVSVDGINWETYVGSYYEASDPRYMPMILLTD